MELLTKQLRDQIPALYATEADDDPIVHAKFFTPDSNWTWLVTEFDGSDIFFGYVMGHYPEYGYFSLRELEEVRGPLGLPIERDLHFTPAPISKLIGGKTDGR